MPVRSEAEALEIAAVITAIRQREADQLAWAIWAADDDFTPDGVLFRTSERLPPMRYPVTALRLPPMRYPVTALVSQKT
jgi:hypothetical protein